MLVHRFDTFSHVLANTKLFSCIKVILKKKRHSHKTLFLSLYVYVFLYVYLYMYLQISDKVNRTIFMIFSKFIKDFLFRNTKQVYFKRRKEISKKFNFFFAISNLYNFSYCFFFSDDFFERRRFRKAR